MIKVLLIEDDEAVRETLALKLSKGDYQVFAVASRDAALPDLEEKPDVILMDCAMPGLSIEPFLDEIHRRCPTAMVVLMSTANDAGEAVRLGIRHFVAKFFDFPKLTQTLQMAYWESCLMKSA